MPKFKVSYTMDMLYEIEVDAADEIAAFSLVQDGDADYDKAVSVGEEFGSINNVEEI